MTYICIKCKNNWIVGEPTAFPHISGGLCETCMTKYVRNRQKKDGYHDCFKRAVEVCDRLECSYWLLCAYPLIG